MTPRSNVWLAAFMALLFATGTLAGVILERTWLAPAASSTIPAGAGGPRGRGPGPAGRPPLEQIVNRLDRDLHFTGEQRQKVVTILQAWDERVRQLQETARREFSTEQEAIRREVAAVLTADQAKVFSEIAGSVLAPGAGRGGPFGRDGGRGPGRRGRE